MRAEDLFNSYRERSTAKLKFESDMGLIEIPAIASGTGIAKFKVGDKVVTTNKSILIQGISLTIKEVYFNNKYPRYIMEEKNGIESFAEKELSRIT